MIYVDKVSNNKYIYYNSHHVSGYELPDLDLINSDLVVVQSAELYDYYTKLGARVKRLSDVLGLVTDMGLYEIFSFYFEGKVKDDIDMLELIFSGLLNNSDYCFCLKIGVTFCWFEVRKDRIVKLGTLQFGEKPSKYTVGRFIKRLKYQIAKSGVNLNKIRFLTWNKEDISEEFSTYITNYINLESFFGNIDGLKGLTCANVVKLLSKNIQLRFNVTAETLVDALQVNFRTLGIYEKDGVLYSRNAYLKDYSICVSSILEPEKCTYGIIIDCEGKLGEDGSLQNGCRELGGLIYCKYDNILLNIDTFVCDEKLIEDTLERVFENYKELTNQMTNINVLVYGYSDVIMLQSSLEQIGGKKFRKKVLNRVNIVDCQPFLNDYIEKKGLEIQKNPKLTKLATELKVSPVYPKHMPLNDARTLFNILAKILQITDEFVV